MKFEEIIQSELIKSLIKQGMPEKAKLFAINEICDVGADNRNINNCGGAIRMLDTPSIDSGLRWRSMPSGKDFWRKVNAGNVTNADIPDKKKTKEPEEYEWKTFDRGMTFCSEDLTERIQE